MRASARIGSVTFNKRFGTWVYLWWDNGKRHSRTIGTREDFPTRESAWQVARKARIRQEPSELSGLSMSVNQLTALYRDERMPARESTRRGYNFWLGKYALPKWGSSPIAALQPRPVELWLRSLAISSKSKTHIRGLLSLLWDYAMWRGDVPIERNPMELVRIEDASKRTHEPRSLTAEQFQKLLTALSADDDCLSLRTMLLLAVSFGLRISEVLGLKWRDVDWLKKTIRIERGVVKQVVDDVKTRESARTMSVADELLEVLKLWKQATEFVAPDDWVFASPVKLGRDPLSYSYVWKVLTRAAGQAGIGHVSSHTFRHTYRTWLDSVGTPVGVQQKLMRHADIRTTMNIYGDAMTADMQAAQEKITRIALASAAG